MHRHTHPRVRASLVGFVALMLAGLTGGAADSATVPALRAEPSASVDYVALGDSYSAGPLIPQPRTDPFACFRSVNNYPAYLAGYLGVATYRDVTCSGASTSNFENPQPLLLGDPAPAQLDALSAETDLVTVGIGGNDFGLFGTMIDTCGQLAADHPRGDPCRRQFTNRQGVDTKARDARKIQRNVGKALAAVHRRAPNAAVYVVGYPRLLPLTGSCTEVGFATGDYAWGRHVEWLLNRSLHQAADNHRATYLNLYPATKGHDACAGDQAWINGHELKFGVAANFHPFQVGERGMGRAAYHRMTGLVAPSNEDAEPPLGSIILNTPATP